MNTCYRSIGLAALISVCVVHHVSGFTQTDNADDRDERRSSPSVMRVYVAEQSASFDEIERAPNLTVSPIYRPIIETMLANSATFRRQSARIAAATYLSIEIRSDPPPSRALAALTSIVRQRDGRLTAVVYVGLCHRTAELIAHEIEHIIEQLDGVDLLLKSRQRSSGVHRRQDDHLDAFETTRAIATGLRVSREVLESPGR